MCFKFKSIEITNICEKRRKQINFYDKSDIVIKTSAVFLLVSPRKQKFYNSIKYFNKEEIIRID